MLKKILIGLAIVVAALAGVISTRPSTFTVQRTATIQAPADIPFAMVNDFHRWGQWSPWEKLDPNQSRTFTGANAGLDSVYEWSGNDKVGKGRMTIEESKPSELVRIRLEFLEPWEANNTTAFSFMPTGDGVTVTWKMEGQNTFMGKAFSLFMDMDSMIGKDFESGLATMKTAAEAEAKKQAEEKAVAEKAAAEAAAAAAAAPAPTEGQPAAGTATAPAP
ncbi:SRPBCC family protein [Hyalangium sp.]|uniref:SRPBCC family protein n=1 Tax=Hyalangium sp. TaxID=2028555 RepID=UPI002D2631A8|nr:SRPBCC family protein [Hyalangium sp.]HYH98746.1 SRPBCC family protein [Hyalangium sp.]